MKIRLFVCMLLFALDASAEYAVRCGEDAFGNPVCMDKAGVLTNAPKKSAIGKSSSDADDKTSGAKSDPTSRTDQEDSRHKVRCGTDPFGNTVCALAPGGNQENNDANPAYDDTHRRSGTRH